MQTVRILGVPVHRVHMAEALETVERMVKTGRPHLIVTPNAEMIWAAAKSDPELKQIIERADLAIPDGIGVVLASRYLGQPVAERVSGFDLMMELMALAPAKGYRIFLLGAAPGVADLAREKLQQKFPGAQIVGTHHGYFSAEQEPAVIAQIRAAKPDILFAGMGVPRQEKWLANNLHRLQVPVSIGVGGSLDVAAGKVERAPRWIQKIGLEWLFRLIKEPWRYKRMLALPRFAMAVVLSGRGKGDQ